MLCKPNHQSKVSSYSFSNLDLASSNNPRKMMLHVQIVWEDREEAEYRLGLRANKGENAGEANFK